MNGYPFFAKYGKSIGALAFFVYTTAIGLWTGDHHIDATEGVIIAVAVANGVLVFIVPMAPGWRWGKSAIGVVLPVLAIVQTVIGDGIDGNDVYLIAGALVTALGIPILPAVSEGAATSVPASGDVVAHMGSDSR